MNAEDPRERSAVPGRVSPMNPAVEAIPRMETKRSTESPTVEALATFEVFYRVERAGIVRALALALGDVDLATEAADEAFARAYERWTSVHALDRPAGWVYRVGLNWATSVLRRRKRHDRLYETETVTTLAEIIDPAVHLTLAELNVDQRAVVVCRYWLGWTVPEIADSLGLREGTVKSRLHRAHRILQQRLSHLDPSAASTARGDDSEQP